MEIYKLLSILIMLLLVVYVFYLIKNTPSDLINTPSRLKVIQDIIKNQNLEITEDMKLKHFETFHSLSFKEFNFQIDKDRYSIWFEMFYYPNGWTSLSSGDRIIEFKMFKNNQKVWLDNFERKYIFKTLIKKGISIYMSEPSNSYASL